MWPAPEKRAGQPGRGSKVSPLGVVRVRFNDGVEKRVNVLPLLDRGPYLELRDPVEFARVRLDKGWGVLRWPGNRDIAPEALHDLPDEPEASTRRTPRAR